MAALAAAQAVENARKRQHSAMTGRAVDDAEGAAFLGRKLSVPSPNAQQAGVTSPSRPPAQRPSTCLFRRRGAARAPQEV